MVNRSLSRNLIFDETRPYKQGEITFTHSNLWEAKTDMPAGPWDNTGNNWYGLTLYQEHPLDTIYIQYYGFSNPSQLGYSGTWEDITTQYANRFLCVDNKKDINNTILPVKDLTIGKHSHWWIESINGMGLIEIKMYETNTTTWGNESGQERGDTSYFEHGIANLTISRDSDIDNKLGDENSMYNRPLRVWKKIMLGSIAKELPTSLVIRSGEVDKDGNVILNMV